MTKSKKKVTSKKKKVDFNPRSSDVRKHKAFYYAIPGNLQKEIKRLGYPFDIKTVVITYVATVLIMMAAGFAFKLPFVWQIPLIIAGLLCAPVLIFNSYRNKYEKSRFSDVNVYIQQMLYAFKSSQKILTSLEDVRILFPSGPMREIIDKACEIIPDPTAVKDHENVEEYALGLISERYNNLYIKKLHRFMLKVEGIGGNFDSSISLLLKERAAWENRMYALRDKRSLKKSQILVSCLMTLALCAFMLYILPEGVNLAAYPLVRIGNIAITIVCMLIYIKGDSKLSSSLLTTYKDRSDASVMATYDRYIHYNPKKEMIKSLIWCIVPFILIVTGRFIAQSTIISLIGVALLPVMLMQHSLGHALAGKLIKREISLSFPQWLMELALLLQADNVQVSIFKTISNAPVILQPELKLLKERLLDQPDSSEPFLKFFSYFQLPEVTTAMQMLYSLSAGSGGSADDQIANLIERNNLILDRAETTANDNSMASMMILFLLPALLGGLILMLDMTMFLGAFMSTMSI